ncbi:MAG: hypothetical protein GX666_11795 [Tissierellia bacterium]|nr:hypothetical protein [Tissierellia bacterium]
MKRFFLVLFLVLLVANLTSCEFVDSKIINETHKPDLHASPINGIWNLEEIVDSDSRYSFEKGDKFYFNIDFFATTDKIYLNPDFEIINVNWKSYLREIDEEVDISNFFISEKVNVVEIKKDGLVIAEAIPLNNNELLLNISNELVILKRETDVLTNEEKNELKMFYSEREKVFRSGDSWALALGVRNLIEDNGSNIPKYDYNTILLRFSNKGLRVDNLDGIVINNDSMLDIYDSVRISSESGSFDRITLNGKELGIFDHDGLRQSNIFRLNYISPRYATIEYIYPDKSRLNTLSTYTTLSKGGLNQLKIDNIVNYSTERVMDAITKSNSETTFSQAVYNIGMTKDSGLTVLKGRVVSSAEGEKFNSDYILSSSFSYVNNQPQRRVNFQELKATFPDIVDALPAPVENQYILITKTGIDIYKLDRITREYEKLYTKNFNTNTSIISNSWFNEVELVDLEKALMNLRVK